MGLRRGRVIGISRRQGSTLLHVEGAPSESIAMRIDERRGTNEPVQVRLGDRVEILGHELIWEPWVGGGLRLPILLGPH